MKAVAGRPGVRRRPAARRRSEAHHRRLGDSLLVAGLVVVRALQHRLRPREPIDAPTQPGADPGADLGKPSGRFCEQRPAGAAGAAHRRGGARRRVDRSLLRVSIVKSGASDSIPPAAEGRVPKAGRAPSHDASLQALNPSAPRSGRTVAVRVLSYARCPTCSVWEGGFSRRNLSAFSWAPSCFTLRTGTLNSGFRFETS